MNKLIHINKRVPRIIFDYPPETKITIFTKTHVVQKFIVDCLVLLKCRPENGYRRSAQFKNPVIMIYSAVPL